MLERFQWGLIVRDSSIREDLGRVYFDVLIGRRLHKRKTDGFIETEKPGELIREGLRPRNARETITGTIRIGDIILENHSQIKTLEWKDFYPFGSKWDIYSAAKLEDLMGVGLGTTVHLTVLEMLLERKEFQDYKIMHSKNKEHIGVLRERQLKRLGIDPGKTYSLQEYYEISLKGAERLRQLHKARRVPGRPKKPRPKSLLWIFERFRRR